MKAIMLDIDYSDSSDEEFFPNILTEELEFTYTDVPNMATFCDRMSALRFPLWIIYIPHDLDW